MTVSDVTVPGGNSSTQRSTIPISSKFENRLHHYAIAAGAAGVGLMAIAQPAEAKIVYTPLANVNLIDLRAIDLNNDGVVDFNFIFYTTYHGAAEFFYPVTGNQVIFGRVNHSSGTFPLPFGARIGPKNEFSGERGLIAGVAGCHSTCQVGGPWQNKTNHYLGLKFSIAGHIHYGWMRLTVTTGLNGFATGYAYEDTPGKPILAGHTSSPASAPDDAPAELPLPAKPFQTLGMLALGNNGVAIWRRENEEENLLRS